MSTFKQLGNGQVEKLMTESLAYVLVVVNPNLENPGAMHIQVINSDLTTPSALILREGLKLVEQTHAESVKNN